MYKTAEICQEDFCDFSKFFQVGQDKFHIVVFTTKWIGDGYPAGLAGTPYSAL